MADNIQFIPDSAVANDGIGFTPDENQPDPVLAQHQTIPGNIASGALGALNTATAGLAGKGLEKIGVDPEFQRQLREANPIAYGVGQVGGLFSLAGEATGAAGNAVKAAIGEGVAGTAAKLATENALFQTTDEVAKHVMQDPNQTTQTAAVNIGLAGLFGGAFGTVGGIAGKGVEKIADSKLGEFLNDFKNRVAEHVAPESSMETTFAANHEQPGIPNFPNHPDEPLLKEVQTEVPKPEMGNAESLGAKAADAFMKSKLAGRGLGFEAGQMMGRATGIPGVGYIGGIAGAKTFGPTIDAVIKPLIRGAANAVSFDAANNLIGNVIKGDNLITNAAKAVFDKSMDVIPAKLAPDQEKRDALQEHVQAAQQSPSSMMNVGGNLSPYLPNHDTAVGQLAGMAIQHLQAIAPKPINGGAPLDSQNKVSKAQQTVYNRSLDIAQQPLMMLEHVKNGTVLPSDLNTFMAIYPKLHQKMSQSLTTAMIDHMSKGNDIPYKTRMGMSMFMGQPMDSTMNPMHMQITQAAFQKANQPQQPQQATKAKKSTAPLSKVSSNYATPSQARQERANKG